MKRPAPSDERDVGERGGESVLGQAAADRWKGDLLRLSYVCHASDRLCGRPGRGIVLAEIHRRFDEAPGRGPTTAALADLVHLIEGASDRGCTWHVCSEQDGRESGSALSPAENMPRPS